MFVNNGVHSLGDKTGTKSNEIYETPLKSAEIYKPANKKFNLGCGK